MGNSTTLPIDVILPIRLPSSSVNHRLPSDPTVIPHGALLAVGIGNSRIVTRGSPNTGCCVRVPQAHATLASRAPASRRHKKYRFIDSPSSLVNELQMTLPTMWPQQCARQ